MLVTTFAKATWQNGESVLFDNRYCSRSTEWYLHALISNGLEDGPSSGSSGRSSKLSFCPCGTYHSRVQDTFLLVNGDFSTMSPRFDNGSVLRLCLRGTSRLRLPFLTIKDRLDSTSCKVEPFTNTISTLNGMHALFRLSPRSMSCCFSLQRQGDSSGTSLWNIVRLIEQPRHQEAGNADPKSWDITMSSTLMRLHSWTLLTFVT